MLRNSPAGLQEGLFKMLQNALSNVRSGQKAVAESTLLANDLPAKSDENPSTMVPNSPRIPNNSRYETVDYTTLHYS